MSRPRARGAAWLGAALGLVVGCFELSGPRSSLSAISPLLLPWPAVVVGDTLRDSTGKIAPLTVEAFDGKGELVSDARVTIIALDTGLIVLPGGLVKGDRLRTSAAQLVAHVQRGADVLQTPVDSIAVVPRPDTVSPARFDTLAVTKDTLVGLGDTSQVKSGALTVTVSNRARIASGQSPATVRSWIVRYEITQAPPGANGATTAFFADTRTARIALDTTDASGIASRQVVLRTSVLPPPQAGTYRVNVIVTVKERGRDVAGSPIEFVVPFEISSR